MKRAITLTGTIQYAPLKSTSPVDMLAIRARLAGMTLAGMTSGKAVFGQIIGLRIDAISWLKGSHSFSLAQLGTNFLASQPKERHENIDAYQKGNQNRPCLKTEPNITPRSGGRSHLANHLAAMPT